MKRLAGAAIALVFVLGACGGERDDRPSLRVAAASSLTEVFTELARTFEKDHPDIDVVLDFGASSAIARGINEGNPADVFASADATSMGDVVDAGNVAAPPEVIARNRLAIVVEKGNPKGIDGLADLAGDDVTFVMCAAEVPCGRLGAAALAKAGVQAKAASLEETVKAVLGKVRLGEADAGIVYATDVAAGAGNVDGVPIDGADDPALEAVYLMAVTRRAANPDAARDWVDLVFSEIGQRAFADQGFLPRQ